MTDYFSDANVTEANRHLFAFASYNVGSRQHLAHAQGDQGRGFDPDQWFNNVGTESVLKTELTLCDLPRNVVGVQTGAVRR